MTLKSHMLPERTIFKLYINRFNQSLLLWATKGFHRGMTGWPDDWWHRPQHSKCEAVADLSCWVHKLVASQLIWLALPHGLSSIPTLAFHFLKLHSNKHRWFKRDTIQPS